MTSKRENTAKPDKKKPKLVIVSEKPVLMEKDDINLLKEDLETNHCEKPENLYNSDSECNKF